MRTYLILFCLLVSGLYAQREYLHEGWEFQQEGTSSWYPAGVPGTVHQDLMRQGIIEDPYWENNEHLCQWVEKENWIYRCTISLEEGQKPSLHFEGLDTYAEVFVDDSLYGFCQNMHRHYSFDLSQFEAGEHELKIRFRSPYQHHQKRVEAYPYKLPSGSEAGDLKVSPFSRKAAYHFGWDWAPRIVTSGIYRQVYLVPRNTPQIISVETKTDVKEDRALVSHTVQLNDTFPDLTIAFREKTFSMKDKVEGETFLIDGMQIRYMLSNIEWWWPNGLGEPHLYYDTVFLKRGEEVLHSYPIQYGIRTVELVNEADSIGTSFYFKINGKPIFAKGANYVPQDMLLPRVSDRQYRELLTQAAEANMNMIRVWGGGVYEKEIFYDLCDSLGLMVWQDFMFAGTVYPADLPEFVQEVKSEVSEVTSRLNHHPSIVLWCGNNEVEVAWNNWGWQKQFGYTSEDSIRLWEANKALFSDVIPKAIQENFTGEIPYTRSSPLSNWGTAENFNHSSMHYWGVWHGRDNFEAFGENVGRFMVEYGFQSFPGWSSLKSCMADSSLHLNSQVMQNRQKSYIGNTEILRQVERYYPSPSSFEDFVYKSQLTQAKALEMAIKAHRSREGHCTGSLIWQLNDCWPGPSWSLIDYYGREKEAYYSVKKAFAP